MFVINFKTPAGKFLSAARTGKKRAAALLELVFAIVLMSVALASIPQVIDASERAQQSNLRSEQLAVLEFLASVYASMPFSDANLCGRDINETLQNANICASTIANNLSGFADFSYLPATHLGAEKAVNIQTATGVMRSRSNWFNGSIGASVISIASPSGTLQLPTSELISFLDANYFHGIYTAGVQAAVFSSLQGDYCKHFKMLNGSFSGDVLAKLEVCSGPAGRLNDRYVRYQIDSANFAPRTPRSSDYIINLSGAASSSMREKERALKDFTAELKTLVEGS